MLHLPLDPGTLVSQAPLPSNCTAPGEHVKPYVFKTLTTKALHFSIAETQSEMDVRDPFGLSLEYTRLMMGFALFHPRPSTIAMIGLGGGSLAKFCYRYLSASKISVVEINPHVAALREEFEVPPDSDRFSVILGDGAQFVRSASRPFDVLLVDGFDYHGLPSALCSQRFYDDCVNLLAPAGILVANLHAGHPRTPQRVERLRRSFAGSVLTVNDESGSNTVVFAKKGGALQLLRRAAFRYGTWTDRGAWKELRESFDQLRSALREDTSVSEGDWTRATASKP